MPESPPSPLFAAICLWRCPCLINFASTLPLCHNASPTPPRRTASTATCWPQLCLLFSSPQHLHICTTVNTCFGLDTSSFASTYATRQLSQHPEQVQKKLASRAQPEQTDTDRETDRKRGRQTHTRLCQGGVSSERERQRQSCRHKH